MALVETLKCGDYVVLGGDIMVILVSKRFRLRVIMEKKSLGKYNSQLLPKTRGMASICASKKAFKVSCKSYRPPLVQSYF